MAGFSAVGANYVVPQVRKTTNTATIPLENKEEKKSGLTSNQKGLLALSLVALTSAGVYLLTRGRGIKPNQELEKPVERIKEFLFDTFKQEGNKFVKGKAILKNGENYTGELVKELKDGSKVVCEYKDGLLQKSAVISKDGKIVPLKNYFYDEKSKLKKILLNNQYGYPAEQIYTKLTDTNDILEWETHKGLFYLDKKSKIFRNDLSTKDQEMLYIPGSNIKGHFNYPICYGPNGDRAIDFKGIPVKSFFYENVPLDEEGLTFLYGPNNAYIKQCYFAKKKEMAASLDTFTIIKEHIFQDGKYTKTLEDVGAKFGTYGTLKIDIRTGVVTKGENPLFRYNFRTKEISDLKIDEQEARKIVEFGEEHYLAYKKAYKANKNIIEHIKQTYYNK